jgi:hypothetical protein
MYRCNTRFFRLCLQTAVPLLLHIVFLVIIIEIIHILFLIREYHDINCLKTRQHYRAHCHIEHLCAETIEAYNSAYSMTCL